MYKKKQQQQHENAKAEMNGLKDYVLNVSWCVEKKSNNEDKDKMINVCEKKYNLQRHVVNEECMSITRNPSVNSKALWLRPRKYTNSSVC